MASSEIKGLQIAINRFFGVALGSPIATDGVLGPETMGALNTIMAWMPGGGYSTSLIMDQIGGSLTNAAVAQQAAVLSNALDAIADKNDYDVGVTPNPPRVALVRTPAGFTLPPGTSLIKGKSQRAAAGLLGLGLPGWAIYSGGAAFVLGVAILVVKRRKAAGH